MIWVWNVCFGHSPFIQFLISLHDNFFDNLSLSTTTTTSLQISIFVFTFFLSLSLPNSLLLHGKPLKRGQIWKKKDKFQYLHPHLLDWFILCCMDFMFFLVGCISHREIFFFYIHTAFWLFISFSSMYASAYMVNGGNWNSSNRPIYLASHPTKWTLNMFPTYKDIQIETLRRKVIA